MADDFRVIIDSLGNYSLAMLDPAGVEKIRIWPDADDRTARMEICLREDHWDARSRAIQELAEIREMFLEDLSIDYSFGPSGEGARCDAQDRTAVYAA